jgi:hypothetical protein
MVTQEMKITEEELDCNLEAAVASTWLLEVLDGVLLLAYAALCRRLDERLVLPTASLGRFSSCSRCQSNRSNRTAHSLRRLLGSSTALCGAVHIHRHHMVLARHPRHPLHTNQAPARNEHSNQSYQVDSSTRETVPQGFLLWRLAARAGDHCPKMGNFEESGRGQKIPHKRSESRYRSRVRRGPGTLAAGYLSVYGHLCTAILRADRTPHDDACRGATRRQQIHRPEKRRQRARIAPPPRRRPHRPAAADLAVAERGEKGRGRKRTRTLPAAAATRSLSGASSRPGRRTAQLADWKNPSFFFVALSVDLEKMDFGVKYHAVSFLSLFSYEKMAAHGVLWGTA